LRFPKREEMDERSLELHTFVVRGAGHDRRRVAFLVGQDRVDLEPTFATRPGPDSRDVAEDLFVSLVAPRQRMLPGDVDLQILCQKSYQGCPILLGVGPIELANGCVV
jgi:hypothetical protein